MFALAAPSLAGVGVLPSPRPSYIGFAGSLTMATAMTEGRAVRHDYVRIRRAIRLWLMVVVTLMITMVAIGGATRLNHAGLSITEWQLVHGVIPPLNDAQWQEEFAKYRQIGEFQAIHPDMTVEGFKGIYWWEWAHRMLGRVIGLAVLLPLIFLWATGRIEPQLLPRLVAIFGLVAVQGVLGWWMVASGVSAAVTDVSPLLLALHLVLGCATVAYTTWVMQSLSPTRLEPAAPGIRRMAEAMLAVAFLQVLLGGLVAGLNAGMTFNTWPLMDGEWIPLRLLATGFAWTNFVSDPATVQFTHRIVAYLLLALTLVHMVQTRRTEFAAPAFAIAWVMVIQVLFGILTLVLVVPMLLAMIHQFGAVLIIFSLVIHIRGMLAPLPPPAADPALAGA
jgi:cytochrome c oxidase assembly protein subunit 15